MNVRQLREKLFAIDNQGQSAISAIMILFPEIKEENALLRDALERIAEHGCGCTPVCVCLSEGHIRIELDEKISLAKEALKATE